MRPIFSRLAALCATVLMSGSAGTLSGQDLPDGSRLTMVLSRVVQAPRVDYAQLHNERAHLDSALEQMAVTTPTALEAATEAERLAFWINAYNACMLKRVVDHYPIQKQGGLFTRIRNAFADRPDNSVWQIPDTFTDKHCEIAGAPRSQDEIEHEIIRPMGDPRIHFVVNCAAVSCPPLAAFAYTASELDQQLDAAVDGLLSNPVHFEIERAGEGATVRLNKVLDWYGDDFGGERGLLEFLSGYVDAESAALLLDSSTTVEYFEYDWTLNDVAP